MWLTSAACPDTLYGCYATFFEYAVPSFFSRVIHVMLFPNRLADNSVYRISFGRDECVIVLCSLRQLHVLTR